MWKTFLTIVVVVGGVLVCIFIIRPWLDKQQQSSVGDVTTTKPNLLPSLGNKPVNEIGSDPIFPPGWTGTLRALPSTLPNIPNPSGELYYFGVIGHGHSLTATVPNLVVGQSDQIGGYVYGAVCEPKFEVKLDTLVVLPKASTPNDKFVTFGPVTVKATATSHTIEYCNVTDNETPTCYMSTLLFTGLFFK